MGRSYLLIISILLFLAYPVQSSNDSDTTDDFFKFSNIREQKNDYERADAEYNGAIQINQGYVLASGNHTCALGKKSVPELIQLLDDQNSNIRYCAAYNLGKIGSAEVIPALAKTQYDKDRRVAKAASNAIQSIGLDTPEAVAVLAKALKTEKSVSARYRLISLILRYGTPEHVEILKPLLKDENKRISRIAFRAMAKIQSPEAVDAIVGALEDKNKGVRIQAAHTLTPMCRIKKQ